MSIRERIQSRERPRVPLAVPEWGDGLFVRRLSGLEHAALEELVQDKYQSKTETQRGVWMAAELLVACTVDGDGKQVFEAADVAWLVNDDAKILLEAASIAGELNKLRDKDIEAERKNS